MGFLDFLKKQPPVSKSAQEQPMPAMLTVPQASSMQGAPSILPPASTDFQSLNPAPTSTSNYPPQNPAQGNEWDPFARLPDAPQMMQQNAGGEDFTKDLEVPLPPPREEIREYYSRNDHALDNAASQQQTMGAQPPANLFAAPSAVPPPLELPPILSQNQQLPPLQSIPQPQLQSQPALQPTSQQSPKQMLSIDLPDFSDDDIAMMQKPASSASLASSANSATPVSQETISVASLRFDQKQTPQDSDYLKDPSSFELFSARAKPAEQSLVQQTEPVAGRAAPKQELLLILPSLDGASSNSRTEDRFADTMVAANAIAMPKDSIKLPVGITAQASTAIPTKFISSRDYFDIKSELKQMRSILRNNDDVLKDGLLQHEQLDLLFKKVSDDLNSFELSVMKIDNALFEE